MKDSLSSLFWLYSSYHPLRTTASDYWCFTY